QQPRLLLRRAETAHRVHSADATVDGSQAGNHGVDGRHAGEEATETSKRGALPAVLAVDEHAPVAGLPEGAEQLLAWLVVGTEQGARVAVAAGHRERLLHCRIARLGRRQRRRRKEVQRDLAIPDGPMHGAVRGPVALLEQGLDLLIGLVNGPHAARFFLALAAKPHRRFGKALPVLLVEGLFDVLRGRTHLLLLPRAGG